MALRHVLVEMPDGEVWVLLPTQAAHFLEHRERDPPAPWGLAPMVEEDLGSHALVVGMHPPYLPRRNAEDVRGLQPLDPPLNRFHHHFMSSHSPCLLADSPL